MEALIFVTEYGEITVHIASVGEHELTYLSTIHIFGGNHGNL